MTEILNPLYVFSTVSLEPHTLTQNSLSDAELNKWRSFLTDQDRILRLNMVQQLLGTTSPAEKKALTCSLQRQLLFISDQLNTFLYREKRRWESHPQAKEIRRHYLFTLCFIESLTEFALARFPDYFNRELKITDFRLRTVLPDMRMQLYQIKAMLADKISENLLEILTTGLKTLLDSRSENAVRYIHRLYTDISNKPIDDDETLCWLLLKLDFNQPEFFLYLIENLDQRLFEVHGLHEQQELLGQQQHRFSKVKKQQGFSLHPSQSSLLADLDLYFTERKSAIEALLEIRRAAIKDKVSPDHAFRILMDMTVPQLALFFRIQVEVGLLIKDQITEVFNFVAQHFYTEKAQFISSSNMLKLSTTVEFSTVLKVYDMLSKMIRWLDEQFSVSNYRR